MDRISQRTFPWEVKREKYSIEKRKRESSIPRITVSNAEDPQGLIFEMIDDTESYRINKLVNLLPLTSEAKDIRQIIVFLLKSWDMLTSEQCAIVINEANNLIGSNSYDPDIRAKMALDLRAFIIASKRKSKQVEFENTFEQLRTTNGTIEVESPV